MSIGDILSWGGGALFLLLTFIEITPIKINPWSWLAKKIGKIVNAEVLGEISEIKKTQEQTEEKLDKHIKDDDERDASLHRQRILRFNSELIRGENFTHEYFVEMLEEIDEYERYCRQHPDYQNNRAVMAIDNIKRVYAERERLGNFLGVV